MPYKFQARIIDADTGVSITGIESTPFTTEKLNSADILEFLNSHILTIVGQTRVSANAISPPTEAIPKGDQNSSVYLRQFAEMIDNGKYVLSVVRRTLHSGVVEVTIYLDEKKS